MCPLKSMLVLGTVGRRHIRFCQFHFVNARVVIISGTNCHRPFHNEFFSAQAASKINMASV